MGHPPLYMSIHNPILSVPSVAVPDLFVDLSGLQQAFQLKQVENFLETIVKKRGNIYLEWLSPVESFAGLFSVTSTFFKAAEAARPEGRRLWLDHRGCAHCGHSQSAQSWASGVHKHL